MNNGVLYLGTGLPYLKEAKISAQSVKKNNNIPIAVITSESLEQRAEEYSVFDEVVAVDEDQVYDDIRDKSENLHKSPFDNTLYLDGDTYILGDISPAFDILSRVDLAAAHAPVRPVVTINDVPETFPELNGGVICFSSSDKVNSFFERWAENLQKQIDQGRPNGTVTLNNASSLDDISFGRKHEQPPLREALYHSDLQFAALPTEYNYRGNVWAYGDVKIVHRGHGDFASLVKEVVNDEQCGRTCFGETLYFSNGRTVRFKIWNGRISKEIYHNEKVQKFMSKTGTETYIKKIYSYITG